MIEDRFETAQARDEYFDYCLWKYEPIASSEGKFRPVNLLFHSFDLMGVNERVFDFVQAVREGFGLARTVWGLKLLGNTIAWEFYFYDYKRRERERSISKLLDIIRPFAACEIGPNENHHYFMFSIDINDDLIAGPRDLEEIHMYVGNPGSTVSSGICYSLTNQVTKLENFYFFFDAVKEQREIVTKLMSSAHIDTTKVKMDQILWPELRDCRVIVVANKQQNDAVYFSRINVDQLIFFLKRMRYPDSHVFFVEENRSNLDHLLFDVGIDYRMKGDDLVFLKSGYYGIF